MEQRKEQSLLYLKLECGVVVDRGLGGVGGGGGGAKKINLGPGLYSLKFAVNKFC